VHNRRVPDVYSVAHTHSSFGLLWMVTVEPQTDALAVDQQADLGVPGLVTGEGSMIRLAFEMEVVVPLNCTGVAAGAVRTYV
jgi:hypothetical protein